MSKLITVLAGVSMMLAAGAASAQSGTTGGTTSGTTSGVVGSGTFATGVDVIGALILAGNPSVTRSKVGGLANALCRITKSC